MWKIVHQWEERILAQRLDKCVQAAVASKIEQLNMKLPEYSDDVNGNA